MGPVLCFVRIVFLFFRKKKRTLKGLTTVSSLYIYCGTGTDIGAAVFGKLSGVLSLEVIPTLCFISAAQPN